ncbi:MAG: hypothetical protein K9L82_04735 [Chromatiaceae bacterium]|nr:hypothetical protein [Chromatiaceae bacterium]
MSTAPMPSLQPDDIRLYHELHGPAAADERPPPLILASAEDLVFPRRDDAAGLCGLPNAEYRAAPALAHSLPLEAPAGFTGAVLSFLDRSA